MILFPGNNSNNSSLKLFRVYSVKNGVVRTETTALCVWLLYVKYILNTRAMSCFRGKNERWKIRRSQSNQSIHNLQKRGKMPNSLLGGFSLFQLKTVYL